MKRAIIFCNGNRPPRNLVFDTIKTTDTIICANGGSKHALALGVVPHVIIGDQDSLPTVTRKALKKHPIKWITHPAEKDETDSELALKYAKDAGFAEVIFFGVDGDRTDHFLSNIFLFATATTTIIRIIRVGEEMDFVRGKIVITGKKGNTVSLIPIAKDVKGVTTRGLQWKLQHETLLFGRTRGVSNKMNSTKASISLTSGILLVVHNK